MELRQLEYFVAVAEEASFTRAAERVHISQPGVSAQIRALESELGAELFDRSGRSARLTGAGSAALPFAREALAAAAHLRAAVDDVTGLVRGRLTVGMVQGCEVKPWFEALAAVHDEHPRIELALREANSDVLIADVRAGTTDVALVGIAGEPPEDLAAEVLIREGLAALVPPGHPLEKLPAVPLAKLCAHPIVSLPVGTGIRSAFDQACAAAGLRPAIALEASAPTAVADLGARGLGVAVLSRSMAAAFPDLVARPIENVDVPALLAIVRRPRPGPAATAFLRHCQAAFTDL